MLTAVLVAQLLLLVGFIVVIYELNKLVKGETTVAETLQQLDAVIAGLGTGVTQLITDTNALIAAVQAIPGQDFTNEVNAINADITSLQNLDTSVVTETGALSSSSSSVSSSSSS